MAQKGWLLDLGKCIGCESCTIACKSEMNTPPQASPLKLKQSRLEAPVHTSYRWVVFQNGGAYPNPTLTFVTSSCNHCESPACIASCPVNAISKRQSDGVVLIDQDKCIGCQYCVWACPYGAPQWNDNTRKVEKCTFCSHKLEKGLQPACVTTCVGRALSMVEDFDHNLAGENRPDGFANPQLTRPSIRFVPK